MDLTTLFYAAVVALGLLGVDTVINSGSVVIDVSGPPKSETTEVEPAAVEAQFDSVLGDITSRVSVVRPPELVWGRNEGVGNAVAAALNLEKVGTALKSELGFAPDQLRLSFYWDEGTLRAFVGGISQPDGRHFGEVITQNKDEELMPFVRRCAVWGVSQIAPYATAIYLLGEHASDKDFTDVVALVERVKSELPPTPRSLDRSLFDNLLGLVALFKNDAKGAEAAFANAMAADPTNPVAFINAAFADLLMDDYKAGATRMEQLIRLAPPENSVLLASAYMTWGAALMGLHQLDDADRLLAEAARIAPDSQTVFGLWAEERRLAGDEKTADALHRRELENTATFENYAEVAALYFHLAWRDNRAVELNKFTKPNAVSAD